MYNSPQRDKWIGLLPVGGQDGTLQNRSLTAAVHAKTGSVAHVSALSGYIERPRGWLAFSILVNNFASPGSEITSVMDRISALIMEE
jgi:D-alanyl-D-alanine carboxypeptidase/D-alanyl-D-alanine-endopeptidase (penicillin-binding protein 4)